MTVCANRTDTPGFFTSCQDALRAPCACGAQVAAEQQAAQAAATTEERP